MDIVRGYKIEFASEVPISDSNRRKVFSKSEAPVIQEELKRLLEMGAIQKVEECVGGYISPIFTSQKKDGSTRMILNLKSFNDSVQYYHFKMDTLEHAIALLTPHCWMASIDLRNAYHSIAICPEHQKFLTFQFEECFYQYKCLPFGLSSAPRIFTKVLKPVFSTLRGWGHSVLGYIDDTLLVAQEPRECETGVRDAVELLERLGFVVHDVKSVFTPSQSIVFLGFELNSRSMTVTLTPEKKLSLVTKCQGLKDKKVASIREVSRVIGSLVAACPGVQYGMIYVKPLEIEKNKALSVSRGNFEGKMNITKDIITCLEWWIKNVERQVRNIDHGTPKIVVHTDASLSGWGAHREQLEARGGWSSEESSGHINELELRAVLFGLKSLCKECSNTHIRVTIDNTTAVICVNKQAGTKSPPCMMWPDRFGNGV